VPRARSGIAARRGGEVTAELNPRDRRPQQARTGLWLVYITIAYVFVETIVTLWAGLHDRSVSLESFGLDSMIELGLASVLAWRLGIEAHGAEDERLQRAERLASWWAGIAFCALGLFIALNSGYGLWSHAISRPDPIGLGMTLSAVVVMPILAIAKRRVGRVICSEALQAEADCSMVCAYMAAMVLMGLVATKYLGWWWADSVSSLALLFWIVREGHENLETSAGHKSDCKCIH
jgi:divalent metal cation (Fe/Co/Zn/Cd) transporter